MKLTLGLNDKVRYDRAKFNCERLGYPLMADICVTVLAFDRISPFHLSVPCLVFGEDRSQIGLPKLDFRVCAIETDPIRTLGGMEIKADYGLEHFGMGDIIIIPSWRDVNEEPPVALLDVLLKAQRRGALIVSFCLGSYVVAAAGLLDGRRATTHWAWAEHFAAKFPKINVDSNVLYVDEGSVISSAGVAAALDCCLHIVRREFGSEVAASLARRLVVAPHRQGGQAQFIERPVAKGTERDKFSAMVQDISQAAADTWTVDKAAAMTAMSRRTFTRHFQARFGVSFNKWLIDQRLNLSQRLLESTNRSVDEIAFDSGFGSSAALRLHFAKSLRTTPANYRREFAKHA